MAMRFSGLYLLRKEAYVVLYEDSSLIWFRDRDRLESEGGIFLKDAPEMLAAGQVWHLH